MVPVIWRYPLILQTARIYSDASGKIPSWRSAVGLYCKFNRCAVYILSLSETIPSLPIKGASLCAAFRYRKQRLLSIVYKYTSYAAFFQAPDLHSSPRQRAEQNVRSGKKVPPASLSLRRSRLSVRELRALPYLHPPAALRPGRRQIRDFRQQAPEDAALP